MWLVKYNFICLDVCDDDRRNKPEMLQCFEPSTKINAEAKYDILFFIFMDALKMKIRSKLYLLIVWG